MSSFYVENFGCRATQADGAAIERQLQERGFTLTGAPQLAEVVVLNTCTVTAAADHDVRAAIRRIHRQNPACRILVTGCYAQRAPQEIAAIPGVSAVIGNSHKTQLARIVCGDVPPASCHLPVLSCDSSVPPARPGAAEIYIGDIFAHTELTGAPIFETGAKTRPNLKVQDGCDNRCSFCIIPAVRGRSRSLELQEAIREVRGLMEAGYREVVISGINLGRWGRDLPERQRFDHLLRGILEQTSVEKLRVSSVEPMDWSEELISLVANSARIAKHAHVPMQSGSDRVLRQMHRKYRPWHYADRLHRIRAAMPAAAIGADIMVGFPGETEQDFEATRLMVEQLPFTYLHVFTYSARPGTPASRMPPSATPPMIKERNRILRELAEQKKLLFMRSFVGQEITAITLNVYADGCTEALTDNYLKLQVPGRLKSNQWVTARVESATPEGLRGTIVSN